MLWEDIVFWTTYIFLLYSATFLLITLLTERNMESRKAVRKYPSVSIIVPAYNEERTIGKTIESLLSLDYPKDKLKIIVVDDGSTDNTLRVVKRYEREGIIVLSQKNKGKASAMNLGLKHVDTEFVACLDADSFVEKNALKNMLSYFDDPNVAAVCPLVKVHAPQNMIQKLQWLEYILYGFIKKIFAMINSVHVTPGPFSIYRTGVIKKLGGFDENSLVEDQEIAWRLQKHNYQIRQSMDGVAVTHAPRSIIELYKQRRRWYMGSIITIWKYRDMIFNRKYGDFGLFQAPTLLIGSAILPLAIMLFSIKFIFVPLVNTVYRWTLVGFNLLPDIYWKLKFQNLYSSLMLYDYGKIFIIATLLIVNMFWVYRAYREAGEKMKRHHAPALMLFFIAYYILLSFMWVGAMVAILLRRGVRW